MALEKFSVLLVFLIVSLSFSSAYSIGTDGRWEIVSIPEGEVSLSQIKSSCNHEGGPWIWDDHESDYIGQEVMSPVKGYWLKTSGNCDVSLGSSGVSEVNLESGWNMISVHASQTLDMDRIERYCNRNGGPWEWDSSVSDYEGSESILPDKGYWVNVSSACSVPSDGETGFDEPEHFFELDNRDGNSYEVIPWVESKTVYDTDRNSIEDGRITIPEGVGGSKSFKLRVDGEYRSFSVQRPDFDASLNSGGTVSTGQEVTVNFDFRSNPDDRYDSHQVKCDATYGTEDSDADYRFSYSDSFGYSQECTFETAGPGVIDIGARAKDDTPGTNLEAQTDLSLNVESPEDWEGSQYEMSKGGSQSFSPSVTCEDEYNVGYTSSGSLSITNLDSGRSKSRGTPSEDLTLELNDFRVEVESRSSDPDAITFTPSCGPESEADSCGANELWNGESCVCEDGYYEYDGRCVTENQISP